MAVTIEQCGAKHLRLAAVIIGVVMAIVGAAWGVAISTLNEHEARLRVVEERSSRIEERLIAIHNLVERIDERQSRYSKGGAR